MMGWMRTLASKRLRLSKAVCVRLEIVAVIVGLDLIPEVTSVVRRL